MNLLILTALLVCWECAFLRKCHALKTLGVYSCICFILLNTSFSPCTPMTTFSACTYIQALTSWVTIQFSDFLQQHTTNCFFFTLLFSPFDFYCISPSFSDLFNTLGYSQPDYFQIQNIFLMFNFFSPFSPSKLSFSVLTSKTLKNKALYCLFLFRFLSALCYSLSPSPVPSETNTHSLDILFSTCLNWYPSTIKPNGFQTTPLLLSHQ